MLSIVCDIDGVVADQFYAMRSIIKNMYAIDIEKEDQFFYSYERSFGLPKGSDKLIIDEYNKNYLLDLVPIERSIEGINYLYNANSIVFCTSRDNKDDTEEWLIINELAYDGLYFVPSSKKADFCTHIGADLLIEDCGETCIDANERGIVSLLYDQPWNCDFYGCSIIRCSTWKDIIDKVDSFSKER
jgi:uncharacterized HAD superfamily protein